MEPTIRTATAADDAAIDAIDVATWDPSNSPGEAPKGGEAVFGPGREPEDCFVVEIDGDIAGYVMFRREIPIDANAHVMALRSLGVDPAHQGRGVARALVAAAIEEMRSRGATRIRSRVLGTNPASLAVHRQAGFVIEGCLRGEFLIEGRPVDDVILTLDLPSPVSAASGEPQLTFIPMREEHLEDLIDVMISSHWEYFTRTEHTNDSVRELWNDGAFTGPDHETFLVERKSDGAVIGMVQLNDLQDPIPLFDIRLRDDARGKGHGREAVEWLTQHLLFAREFGSVQAYTRADNAPMRATLERCGYVKEGHYRAHEAGEPESIGYRILRRDVEAGTTTPVRWFDL